MEEGKRNGCKVGKKFNYILHYLFLFGKKDKKGRGRENFKGGKWALVGHEMGREGWEKGRYGWGHMSDHRPTEMGQLEKATVEGTPHSRTLTGAQPK